MVSESGFEVMSQDIPKSIILTLRLPKLGTFFKLYTFYSKFDTFYSESDIFLVNFFCSYGDPFVTTDLERIITISLFF